MTDEAQELEAQEGEVGSTPSDERIAELRDRIQKLHDEAQGVEVVNGVISEKCYEGLRRGTTGEWIIRRYAWREQTDPVLIVRDTPAARQALGLDAREET